MGLWPPFSVLMALMACWKAWVRSLIALCLAVVRGCLHWLRCFFATAEEPSPAEDHADWVGGLEEASNEGALAVLGLAGLLLSLLAPGEGLFALLVLGPPEEEGLAFFSALAFLWISFCLWWSSTTEWSSFTRSWSSRFSFSRSPWRFSRPEMVSFRGCNFWSSSLRTTWCLLIVWLSLATDWARANLRFRCSTYRRAL